MTLKIVDALAMYDPRERGPARGHLRFIAAVRRRLPQLPHAQRH